MAGDRVRPALVCFRREQNYSRLSPARGEGARALMLGKLGQTACKPGSVRPATPEWTAIHLGRPLPDASSNQPGRRPGNGFSGRTGMPPLFGLAPGGVCRAAPVTGRAVRSYRTLSPLPVPEDRRFAFCGTFPGVAPAGRYPAPCFRGARTFLCPGGQRPSGHLTHLT